ncbi:trypsin-like serine peptidase [Amycolatopsis anabasis]|uniref:trypsin-like serine peptidase n=1 Tax=Amycolatopsis anabasis TaxID=1840409 RepID=UPI001FE410EC|nr:hypothetical protein [Amycolatopsis anabasis]
MKTRLIRSLVACALMVDAAAVVGVVVIAPPSEAEAKRQVVHQDAATTREEQDRIVAYWTTERMAAAVPARSRLSLGVKRPSGARSDGAALVPAQPRLGKVFFTVGGVNYVCSGASTESRNGDVVTTAGHCLHEGPGAFATNFAFVPAYDNGARPYGTWTARKLFTAQKWAASGDFDYDVGFAAMNKSSDGRSLTQVAGSYPISFNLPRGLTYTSYGYPATSQYKGQNLYSCSGTAIQDSQGTTSQGLKCDMTSGASGGGWLTRGRLNSVNSFKYSNDPGMMWGPYFGSVVQAVYASAGVA